MPEKPLLEDLIALGSSVYDSLKEARHDLKSEARKRAHTLTRKLDLVSRNEFDAAFAMLAKIRQQQEDLAARMTKIEARLKPQNTVNKKSESLRIVKGKPVRRTRRK